ncbi:hypothetical protein ALC57_08222 [Trachymyrmex cornetzi]|uniref:Uncharacterized protein n=1 Tax=Trachymyrmex cornetzi TaxID=471704 RepID=A0A195E2R5_9HYME|nr:hypothetical protein ALC57_08222 [Trachymyrmex cornetzi]
MLDPADPAHRPDRPNRRTYVVPRCRTLPSLRAALWHVARAACGVPCSPRDRKETRRRPRGTKERAGRCR